MKSPTTSLSIANCLLLLLLLSAVVSLFAAASEIEYAPVVQLQAGKVRGRVVEALDSVKVHFYEGIRFGQAKRYEKPTPVAPWTGIYNATEKRAQCPQMMLNITINGLALQSNSISEDCLFLSVWKPAVAAGSRNHSLPVMFFVHGGGFAMGTVFSDIQDARYLVAEGNVIVVSVAYRLANFGFLYGGDVIGNLGLHDQLLGLHWVNQNIAAFGGDPNQVTIFGASAGSFSVGSIILSPLSKGLFRRAILQSGAPNSRLGAIPKSKSLEKTIAFATRLGCPNKTAEIQSTINCLKGKSVEQLLQAERFDLLRDELFTPIYGDEFMPTAPVKVLNEGSYVNKNIDLMVGGCADEGSGFVLAMFPTLRTASTTLRQTREHLLTIAELYNVSQPQEVVDYYLQGLSDHSTQDQFKIAIGQLLGDYHLVCPTILLSEQLAKHSSTDGGNTFFTYRLVQHLEVAHNPMEHFPWQGVTHGEDSMYIYAISLLQKAEDRLLSRSMITAWTNFAKSGHPGVVGGVQWEEAFQNREHPVTRHLSLHTGDFRMVSGAFAKNCDALWKNRITQ